MAVESPSSGAARQAAWNYLIFALSKSSTLVMTIVLARLLVPADFGLFALGLLMLNLFDYLRDLGVGAALVQREGEWGRLAPTGLTLTAVFGVLMAAATVSAAPVIASALGNPALTDITRVLAIGLLISSAATLPQAYLRRRIDFRRRLLPELAGALAKMVVAIGLAVGGAGVWSLVWAQLSAAAVTTVFYWLVAGSAGATFGIDRDVARSLLRFGLPVTAVGLLSFVVFSVPTTAIGRHLGSTELGLYTLAYRLPELLVLNLCAVIGEVLFSALSRLQDDPARLRSRYLAAVAMVMTVVAPIGLGIAVVAGDLIVLLYGSRYAPAAPALAVLAAFTVLCAASFHSGDVYKAIGRPMILTWMTVGGLVLLIPVVWLAAMRSTLAVATALVGLETVFFAVRINLVARVLGLPVREQLRNYLGPLTAALLMAALVWTTGLVLPTWPPAARLAILVPVGAISYGVLIRLLAPAALAGLLAVVGRGHPQQPGAPKTGTPRTGTTTAGDHSAHTSKPRI